MGELERNSYGGYEEDSGSETEQTTSDRGKASQLVEQQGEIQSRAMSIHKEEYIESHETEEDFDEVWNREYNKSDKFQEYLVNGALLTCTQATVEPFIIPGYAPIELRRDLDESEFEFKYGYGRKQTRLNVEENGLYLGKMPYATVRDTVMDVNIFPFRCNCAQKISGNSEIEYIQDHLEDCKENGVCKYLMWLNEEWDNMPLPNTGNAILPPSYLSISDVKWERAEDGTMQKSCYNSEGITRTSVLFCRRGGLIVPLTSGQELIIADSNYSELSEDEILLVTTIYGEVCECSESSWKAIANIIMNRVGTREWSKYKTPVEVIKNSGFDVYKTPNDPFLEAKTYFENRDYSNERIERMIQVVMPILRGEEEDITQNAVFYYSPNTQLEMHEKNPDNYKEVPVFASSPATEEVKIAGTENDDLKFYRYK